MSIRALNHVWEHSKQKGNALLVMIAIADMANDDGDCWPGVRKLSTKVRMTERNLQKVIRAIEKSGELVINPRPGQSNLYHIPIGEGVNGGTPGGERWDTGGVNGGTPKPSLEPSKKQKEIPVPEKTAEFTSQEINAVIHAWYSNLPAKPADGKNPYNIPPYKKKALIWLELGHSADDLARYMKGRWNAKSHVEFVTALKYAPAWLAEHPAPRIAPKVEPVSEAWLAEQHALAMERNRQDSPIWQAQQKANGSG